MTPQVTAIDHRYAAGDVLKEILRSPPLSFAAEEIDIRGTNGKGYELTLPRKLHDRETLEVLRILGDDDERTKVQNRINSQGGPRGSNSA